MNPSYEKGLELEMGKTHTDRLYSATLGFDRSADVGLSDELGSADERTVLSNSASVVCRGVVSCAGNMLRQLPTWAVSIFRSRETSDKSTRTNCTWVINACAQGMSTYVWVVFIRYSRCRHHLK